MAGLAVADPGIEVQSRGATPGDEISLPLSESVLPSGSVSCGAPNRGALVHPAELPRAGVGYEIPEPWWSRDRRFGTEELVGLIQRAAATVEAQLPGGVLGVGDLTDAIGGPQRGHNSHQSGRDADLIMYTIHADGQSYLPDGYMPNFRHNGFANTARAPEWTPNIPERYFDVARNWALIEALVTDPWVDVEIIFVSRRIRRWLLMYAAQIDVPSEIRARAAAALKRPQGGSPHNDHMHVRIGCTDDDVAVGRCRVRPSQRPARRRVRISCPASARWVVLPARREVTERARSRRGLTERARSRGR